LNVFPVAGIPYKPKFNAWKPPGDPYRELGPDFFWESQGVVPNNAAVGAIANPETIILVQSQGNLAVVLETAISAQLMLFAGVQAMGVVRFGSVKMVLTALTGFVGLAQLLNLLAAAGIAVALRDLNLSLELAIAALIYLYVSHVHEKARAFTRSDLVHFVPAVFGMGLWKSGVLQDMDIFVLAVLGGYAIASAVSVYMNYANIRPERFRHFVASLAGFLALLVVLRAILTYDAGAAIYFRDSAVYVALLILLLAASSSILVLELRFPNLLSAPASYVKYASVELTAKELSVIGERFQKLIDIDRIYLDPNVTLGGAAGKLGISERHLSHLVNTKFKTNFPSMLNGLRAKHAASMLRSVDGSVPITAIMYDSGFGSKSAFQREFIRTFGISPSEYRKTAGEGLSAQPTRQASP
jgi:AraC-like DNA-binding protein